MSTDPCYLYRLYGRLGELLYVGITGSIASRFDDHRRHKHWWSEVASMSIEAFPNREDVLLAEREAIQLEQPRHNQLHTKSLDLRYAPQWRRRFKLENLPVDISEMAEDDWLRVVTANEILEWSEGYDGRTDCLKIHPDMFNTLVRRIVEGIKHQQNGETTLINQGREKS